MGRGFSYGGGQSTLGYLFAGPEESKPFAPIELADASTAAASQTPPVQNVPAGNKSPPSTPVYKDKLGQSGVVQGSLANKYNCANCQNTGKFIIVSF
ncbi:hypothetical protein MKX03_020585 [Papaver bracteatum]|nr:hypothetical protein MKX03_020585 [Papaver bracteatum]